MGTCSDIAEIVHEISVQCKSVPKLFIVHSHLFLKELIFCIKCQFFLYLLPYHMIQASPLDKSLCGHLSPWTIAALSLDVQRLQYFVKTKLPWSHHEII